MSQLSPPETCGHKDVLESVSLLYCRGEGGGKGDDCFHEFEHQN